MDDSQKTELDDSLAPPAGTQPLNLNEDELNMLLDLLQLETMYQITALYTRAPRATAQENVQHVLKIFHVFSGYRRIDDMLEAVKLKYFKSNPGCFFDVFLERDVFAVLRVCLVNTPKDVKLPDDLMAAYEKLGPELEARVRYGYMQFGDTQDRSNSPLDNQDSKSDLFTNIFDNKASA
jgi:hypothetical protein